MTWAERYGIWRSWLMYYGKPFNQYRLKKFYSTFIKRNDLAFDIGAHLGNRSEAWVSLGARVIAVEPQPLCVDYLRRRFTGRPGFYLLQAVAGSEIGTVTLNASVRHPTISTVRDKAWQKDINSYSRWPATWDHHLKVQMVTVDMMIRDYGVPQFCKIDTEGFEWEVILGLSTPIHTISLEYLAFDRDRILKCLMKLSSLADYVCNFSPGESLQWQFGQWKPVREMINELAVSPLPSRFGDIYLTLDHRFSQNKGLNKYNELS